MHHIHKIVWRKSMVRKNASTQFGIDVVVKDRLDRYKAAKKDEIIQRYKLQRRLVTNSHAIQYLLDNIEKKQTTTKQ